MINLKNLRKKAQSEIIITVLLILIGIAAVGFVGVFLINMIKGNLQQTDCFKTSGQVTLNLGYTFFDEDEKLVYMSVERGSADFNLTGLIVTVGTPQNSKSVTIKTGTPAYINASGTGYAMLNGTGNPIYATISMPGLSEKSGYVVNASRQGLSSVTIVSITPILKDGKACENKADEKEIKAI